MFIHHRGAWRTPKAVEHAALERIDWFNHRRLLEPVGHMPRPELEIRYFGQRSGQAVVP